MLSTMLTTRYYSSFVLTLTLLFLRSNGDDGLMCSTAPYSEDGFTGEIIRSWSYRKNNPKQLRTFAANYVPRYTFHGFAPVDDPTSKIYEGLDLFSTQLPLDTTAEFVTMKFQREAKVYLFVTGSNKGSPALTLPDWNPEGWAEIVMGSHTKKTELGIVKPRLWKPSKFAYVFSKATTAMEVKLPGKTYVAENLTGMTVGGNYWVMVAEEDGAAVEKPAIPANKMDEEDVIAGKHCPDWLHNEWKAPVRPGEYDVGENTFKTAHPIWDPCYWCAFDHEHGSVPMEAMGFWPRLGYIAFKNGNEAESHTGFKGLMVRLDDYLVYYGLHSQLSVTRRFTARHHSIVIAVVNARTKELMMEMGYKGDFGFAAVRILPKGLAPVNANDVAIKNELLLSNSRAKRVINVINPANLDSTYKYRDGNALMKGRYEQWFLQPICSNSKKRKEIVVDFQSPATALPEKGSDAVTILGSAGANRVVTAQAKSINRDLRTFGNEIGEEFCLYTIPADGVFYTDKLGSTLVDGPAPEHSFRQYIKPRFKFTITGRYMTEDNWVGMHGKGKKGRMNDPGRAIVPETN